MRSRWRRFQSHPKAELYRGRTDEGNREGNMKRPTIAGLVAA